jgi:hypothetical protein
VTRQFGVSDRPSSVENTCSRHFRDLEDALERGDWDVISEAYAENIEVDDRRAGLRHTWSGRAAQIEQLRVGIELAGPIKVQTTTIATRGERIAMIRTLLSSGIADGPGFEGEMIEVVELNDASEISRETVFDPDDFTAAYAELEDRFIAGEGAPFASNVELHNALLRALGSKHTEDIPDLLADDFAFVDHRPASFGELTGEKWIAIQAELLALVDEQWSYAKAFHALTEDTLVADIVTEGRTIDGGTFEMNFVGLRILRDGKHTHMEIFPEGDVPAALRRLEELTTSSG